MQTNKWFLLWFTWLSWAWKTTIAQKLYSIINKKWYENIKYIDWDEVRKTISKDLWYSKKDREENLRRINKLTKILTSKWFWVIATFISPYEKGRYKIRENNINYIEIYISTSIEICEKRDVKWLYKRARNNQIENFTWISAPYELPINPEININTEYFTVEESTDYIYKYLIKNNYL